MNTTAADRRVEAEWMLGLLELARTDPAIAAAIDAYVERVRQQHPEIGRVLTQSLLDRFYEAP